jgi:chromosomal replication initiation ATPase DnaA
MSNAQQLILKLEIPSIEKNNFLLSASNWEAFQWVERWPNWSIKHLAIYGEVGCGKSHLARLWAKRAGATLIQPSDTLNHSPHDLVSSNRYFAIDDYDQIRHETWLFHFYNLVQEKAGNILFCGLNAPGQTLFFLPDLASRLRSVSAVEILAPEENLIKELLKQLLSYRGLQLTEELAEYLVRRMERSYKAIHQLIFQIDELSLALQRPITLSLLKEITGMFEY